MSSKFALTLGGFAALAGSALAYEAFHGPTELIYSDPDKVAPGYLLFAAWAQNEAHETVYLVDVNGECRSSVVRDSAGVPRNGLQH